MKEKTKALSLRLQEQIWPAHLHFSRRARLRRNYPEVFERWANERGILVEARIQAGRGSATHQEIDRYAKELLLAVSTHDLPSFMALHGLDLGHLGVRINVRLGNLQRQGLFRES
jgi:hypothetical protein